MKLRQLAMCGVLTTVLALALLTVILPQGVVAAPPQATYTCFTCPAEGSFPQYVTTVTGKAAAQEQCRAAAVFCVDLSPDSPGNPIACVGCR